MLLMRVILFLIVQIQMVAIAGSLPGFLREGNSRFLSRSLGSACFSMDSIRRGLPCNPAAVAKDRQSRFDGGLFLGSNIDYMDDAEKILDGEADDATVARLFGKRQASEAEASFEFSYQAAKWGLSFEPYRFILYTRFENPALPMIDFITAQEQNARLQLASYVSNNFYAGLQLRYTHVKFIGKYFALSEAAAGDNENFFRPETQELVYFEPGFLYAWEERPWQPQISAALTGWGYSDRKSAAYPIQPEGQFGASIKPLVPLGLLEVGLHFQLNSETESAWKALRAAVAYELGILHGVLAISDSDQSAGFLVRYQSFTSGLSYWHEDVQQGVYVQFGVTL